VDGEGKDSALIVDYIDMTFQKARLPKNRHPLLDLIANNDGESAPIFLWRKFDPAGAEYI